MGRQQRDAPSWASCSCYPYLLASSTCLLCSLALPLLPPALPTLSFLELPALRVFSGWRRQSTAWKECRRLSSGQACQPRAPPPTLDLSLLSVRQVCHPSEMCNSN